MTYIRSVGDDRQAFSFCQTDADRRVIARVRNLLGTEDFEAAHELLAPLILRGNAEAEYLGASFSWGAEQAAEFDQRHIGLLRQAARKGYPPALYTLGVYLDTGELLEVDKLAAAAMFKQAAEAGHAHSKWIYGIDLLYGLGAFQKDETKGVALVIESANAGFQGALETLAGFYETGEFGFTIDRRIAQALRARAVGDEVITY